MFHFYFAFPPDMILALKYTLPPLNVERFWLQSLTVLPLIDFCHCYIEVSSMQWNFQTKSLKGRDIPEPVKHPTCLLGSWDDELGGRLSYAESGDSENELTVCKRGHVCGLDEDTSPETTFLLLAVPRNAKLMRYEWESWSETPVEKIGNVRGIDIWHRWGVEGDGVALGLNTMDW